MFFVYFTNTFWKYILNYYNEPKQYNILICFKLREVFIKYYELVKEVFKEKDNKFNIKNEAIKYYEKDEFAIILNQIIQKYINNNKYLNGIEKLAFIAKYNPYYIEPKYINKVNLDILDLFSNNDIDNEFIENFKRMDFELIFKENISEYTNKILSKIQDISNFKNIIELINIKNIEDKKIFLDSLNKKYDSIIKNKIMLLEGEKLTEAVKVISKINIINFIYETKTKRLDFIKNRIKNLDKKIIHLILIETMKICIKIEEKNDKSIDEEENKREEKEEEYKDIDYKEMKDFIFEEYVNKLENEDDINNIINLIDCLEGKDKIKNKENNFTKNEKNKKEFFNKLMKNNLFTKEDFFSSNQNIKIDLLIKLLKRYNFRNDGEYYDNIVNLLNDIKQEIEGNIKKKKLEDFLKNDENFIKKRLSLIKIIIEYFNPEEEYMKLKVSIDKINKDIEKLNYIKSNIIIYYKETYQNIIKDIENAIRDNPNKKIKDFKGEEFRELLNTCEHENDDCGSLKDLADRINRVKNFLLFNVIYEMTCGRNENSLFEKSYNLLEEIGESIKENTDIIELYNKYKEIFEKINDKLSNNDIKANEFIQNLINYYHINNEQLVDELNILFTSKHHERNINSIIFFFEYFQKDNKNWNEKLPKYYQDISKKDFKEIRSILKELKDNNIYDYKNINNYNKFFLCLYNKKEAIDFLFSKTLKDIDNLKDRIQQNNSVISIKDIEDIKECIFNINKMKEFEDNFQIFEYIKNIDEKTISKFENFSKIYISVIDL